MIAAFIIIAAIVGLHAWERHSWLQESRQQLDQIQRLQIQIAQLGVEPTTRRTAPVPSRIPALFPANRFKARLGSRSVTIGRTGQNS